VTGKLDISVLLSIILDVVIVAMLAAIAVLLISIKKSSRADKIAKIIDERGAELNERIAGQISAGATEQFARFGVIQDSVQSTLHNSRVEINERLAGFSERLDNRLDMINSTLETKIKSLQESNEARLEQMRGVVDEKLQKTLETRLAQSFELVSKRLESVQSGLGEMKNLAADARSLKNALTNVKERGTYGEVRLDKLLSDILAPGQYGANVEIGGGKRVDFAIFLPGAGEEKLLLPIDSKFPIEDYNRLLDAEDKPAIDEARRALARRIRAFAGDIRNKYVAPPVTTDFALMFLPTEGLYAEVARNAGLFEELRDKYKVTAVGAATLSAFLASLQMGFKTLAIEERSREVWDTLREVKSEFAKFGEILDRAHKQIQTADKTLEEIVGKRTKAINRSLRAVGELGERREDNISADTNALYK
jgi:DNA recombination protein RmuC